MLSHNTSKLMIQLTSSIHYTIVTNTIITSIYLLNSARKYISSGHYSGIKKEKKMFEFNLLHQYIIQ